jgi:hypothetical protein
MSHWFDTVEALYKNDARLKSDFLCYLDIQKQLIGVITDNMLNQICYQWLADIGYKTSANGVYINHQIVR